MRVACILLMLAGLLAGCQSYRDDPDSPYYVVPRGAQLTLHRALTFAPGRLSLYIQNGRVHDGMRGVAHYEPFCKFELARQSESRRTVGPARMTVTNTVERRESVPFARTAPRRYAQLAVGPLAQGFDSPGSPILSFVVRMDLASAEEPEIFRLTCARWFYPEMEYLVTVSDIRRTLAPLFTLRLPHEG
jgi:hypothetical protein